MEVLANINRAVGHARMHLIRGLTIPMDVLDEDLFCEAKRRAIAIRHSELIRPQTIGEALELEFKLSKGIVDFYRNLSIARRAKLESTWQATCQKQRWDWLKRKLGRNND